MGELPRTPGIPWLRYVRQQAGDAVHFWPFDGWSVPKDKSVIVEIYPSIFRNRYARDDRTIDQQDAYAVARWLKEVDQREFLGRYLYPPLTPGRPASQPQPVLSLGSGTKIGKGSQGRNRAATSSASR